MATSLATYSAFALNNRPSLVEVNRNGSVNLGGGAIVLPPTVGQHWIPSIDATYDLGENTTPLRWRDLYLSRTAHVAGTVSTTVLMVNDQAIFTNGPLYVGGAGISNYNNNSPNIGTTGAGRWGNAYFAEIDASVKLTAGNTYLNTLTVTGTTPVTFGGVLLPSGILDIGSSVLPWKDLYITGNIYKNGVLYNTGTGGGGSVGDLIPGADNIYVVGTPALRWKDGHFGGTLNTTNLTVTGSATVFSSVTTDSLTCLTSAAIGTSLVVGVTGPSILYSDNATSSLGQGAFPWQNLYATTARLDTVRPINDGTELGNNAALGTSVGVANAAYAAGYFKTINVENISAIGLSPTIGSQGSRFPNAYISLNDATSLYYTNIYRRSGANNCLGNDDSAYDNVPIVRGVIDGTAKSLSGVKSSSAISNGLAYPNVVQYCSQFALAVYAQRLAPGDYWVTIQSQYNATTQNSEPAKRGLPRVNSAYNGASNPRALPVIQVTPYFFPQTRSDQGVAMDSKIYMCVTDVRMVGDDDTGVLPNTPDGSYWQFRVKTSHGQDAVFAFTVWSGFHGQYKAKATSGGAITLAYDYDADYYTDYVNPLVYSLEQPTRSEYRGRMLSLLGNPANKLYSDATNVALFIVGEFVPLLP